MSDEGGGDINWKELLVDKSIDVVLVPLGLFAALWFQGWVDDRKEKEDYKALLKDFQAEIDTNRAKAKAIEDDLGDIKEVSPDKVLGPLQARFDQFRQLTADSVRTVECIDLVIEHTAAKPGGPGDEAAPQPAEPAPTEPAAGEAPPAAVPTAPAVEPAPAPAPAGAAPAEPAAEDPKLAECMAFFDAQEKNETPRFKPIDLAPLYRYEVWQVYLASGIKLFKDPDSKKLGLKLGEAYSAAKEVEKRVEDIEKVFNDAFMDKQGELASVAEEMTDLVGDFDDDQALRAAQPRLAEITQEILMAKYAITNVEEVVKVKSERLKSYVSDMTGVFDALKADIDKEVAR